MAIWYSKIKQTKTVVYEKAKYCILHKVKITETAVH